MTTVPPDFSEDSVPVDCVEFPKGEINVCFHIKFWDGPIDGIAMFRGTPYYFHMILDVTHDDVQRKYLAYTVPDDIMETFLFNHQVWLNEQQRAAQDLYNTYRNKIKLLDIPRLKKEAKIVGWFVI